MGQHEHVATIALDDRSTALLDALPDPVALLDTRAVIVAVNTAFGAVFSAVECAVGSSIEALIPDGALDHPLRASALVALIASGQRLVRSDIVVVRGVDGELRAVELGLGAAVIGEARVGVLSLHDARTRREVERRLHHASTHDALTGLSNRAQIEEMRASVERSTAPFAVVIADVDGLKAVNDKHGHEVGDSLIVAAADAMRCAASSHEDVVARLGGDEFALIVMNATRESLDAAMQTVRAWVRAQRARVGEGTWLSLSVGGALRVPGETLARVMRRADEEMYRDKLSRRGATSASRR